MSTTQQSTTCAYLHLRLQINNLIKMTAAKTQQSYKGKGVQNKHHLVYKYLIKTFLLEGTF